MVGHGGSSAALYLADPTSPIPSHCASIAVTSTVRVPLRCLGLSMGDGSVGQQPGLHAPAASQAPRPASQQAGAMLSGTQPPQPPASTAAAATTSIFPAGKSFCACMHEWPISCEMCSNCQIHNLVSGNSRVVKPVQRDCSRV